MSVTYPTRAKAFELLKKYNSNEALIRHALAVEAVMLHFAEVLDEPDKEKWYIQTGQGMLETLMIAGEQKGYCLTDRGTFIKYEDSRKDQADLVIIVEGDDSLKNQYSVIAVNPAKWENLRYDLAVQFIDWMVSPATQKAVADFSLLGKQLFFPNAGE